MLSAEERSFVAELAGKPPGDEELWIEALTHGSTGQQRDYQRLEFLGDRVLGLVVAEWLYSRSEAAEGELSQRFHVLVSRQTCAAVARAVRAGPHLRMDRQARDAGAQNSDNVLGDVMEALIGACFVENGFDAARNMVRRLWSDEVEGSAGTRKHPKAALQEWAAGSGRKMPEYRLLDRSGPDHAARFTVEVSIKGVGKAQGSASSKQEAETEAATEFMKKYG